MSDAQRSVQRVQDGALSPCLAVQLLRLHARHSGKAGTQRAPEAAACWQGSTPRSGHLGGSPGPSTAAHTALCPLSTRLWPPTCPPYCDSYTSPPGSAGLLRQPLMGRRKRR